MNEDPNNPRTDEEIEELREVIKKIEKLQKDKDKKQKKPHKPFIAIEFGGVFHRNRLVNFVFSFILNFTFAFFVIEIFSFAIYSDILIMLLVILTYSVLEEIYRTYILMKHFPLILKSFGTIFYFGYLLIFFILDQYVFIQDFNFVNGTLLAFFVLFFTSARYLFSTGLRQYFRKRNMR